jgi:hypothetical protein
MIDADDQDGSIIVVYLNQNPIVASASSPQTG